jgi:hypothetical protein
MRRSDRYWRIFDVFRNTIIDKGIIDDDIYNFDETGFAMVIIATSKVITTSDTMGKPSFLQPGNREWVTSIEAVNAMGWALPPMILFKGSTYGGSWFQILRFLVIGGFKHHLMAGLLIILGWTGSKIILSLTHALGQSDDIACWFWMAIVVI